MTAVNLRLIDKNALEDNYKLRHAIENWRHVLARRLSCRGGLSMQYMLDIGLNGGDVVS